MRGTVISIVAVVVFAQHEGQARAQEAQSVVLETHVAGEVAIASDTAPIGGVGEIAGGRANLFFGFGKKSRAMFGTTLEGAGGLGVEGGVFWHGLLGIGYIGWTGPVYIGILGGVGGDGAAGKVSPTALVGAEALLGIHLKRKLDLAVVGTELVPVMAARRGDEPAAGLEFGVTAWLTRRKLSVGAEWRHAMGTDFFGLAVGFGFVLRERGAASTYSTYQETYTPPPEVVTQPTPEAPELPGTYVEGLGDPVITVVNGLAATVTFAFTDASGATQTVTVAAGGTAEVRLAPGVFSVTGTEEGETATYGV